MTARRLHFAVAVWGDAYVETFLQLALPSFLAPGNIPACAARMECAFHVHTRPADEAAIRASPVWRELATLAAATIHPVLTERELARPNRYSVMSFCHRQAIAAALREQAVLCILSPDCVAADGSFAFALDLLRGGKRAVLLAGPRGELESLAPLLKSGFGRSASAALAVPPRRLIALLASHLHPMSQRLFWDAADFTLIPSAVYWRAGPASILAKYFHLHPLVVDLSEASPSACADAGTVDGPFLKLAGIAEDAVHVVTSSDDIALIELSRRQHDWMPGVPAKFRSWRILHWAMNQADPEHRQRFLRYDICLKGDDDTDWQSVKRSAEREFALLRAMFSIAARAPYAYHAVRALRLLLAQCSVFLQKCAAHFHPTRLQRLAKERWRRGKQYCLTVIAPEVALKGAWLYWPLAKLCLLARVRFLVNVPAYMGHNTVELDHYLRSRESALLDPKLRVVLFRQPNAMHRDTASLYAKHFWWAPTGRLPYFLLLPLTMRFQNVVLDGGLSRLKWQLREDLSYERPIEGQTYLYQIEKSAALEKWKDYYRLRASSRDSWPLAAGVDMDEELRAFLGYEQEMKLALFHMKLDLSNATGAVSEAEAYLPALWFLRSQGYRLVFVGREPMPAQFREFGMLDYAQSRVASYRHDIQIFRVASVAVTAGSGIAFLADCLGVPYVYADSWHIGMPTFSERCVIVPALARERASGRLLSLAEQAALYWSLADQGHEAFPRERYEARNATGDEILEAAKEALAMGQAPAALSRLQQRYAAVDARSLLPLTRARVSEYFAEKHESLLSREAAARNEQCA